MSEEKNPGYLPPMLTVTAAVGLDRVVVRLSDELASAHEQNARLTTALVEGRRNLRTMEERCRSRELTIDQMRTRSELDLRYIEELRAQLAKPKIKKKKGRAS